MTRQSRTRANRAAAPKDDPEIPAIKQTGVSQPAQHFEPVPRRDKPGTAEEIAEAKDTYLDWYIRSHGNQIVALQHAGIDRATLTRWCQRDTRFRDQVEYARLDLAAVAEAECFRRAVEGDETRILDRHGNVVDTVFRKSDALLVFWLKANLPWRYNPVVKVADTDSVGNDKIASATPDQLKALCARVAKMSQADLEKRFSEIDSIDGGVGERISDDPVMARELGDDCGAGDD